MAKITTDKFIVRVLFSNAISKFRHMFQVGAFVISNCCLDHVDSDEGSDTFSIKLNYNTDIEKFSKYFSKGKWVESFTAKSTDHKDLYDEFEVEVSYRGKKKKFEKTFHPSGSFKIDHQLINSKTKDLGVLDPYTDLTKNQEQVLGILKTYLVDVAKKAGLTKKDTIRSITKNGEFAVTRLKEIYPYFHDEAPLICIHLLRHKIGFIPIKNEQDRFKIVVSQESKSTSGYYHIIWDDFGLPDRASIFGFSHTYTKYFLGDPKLEGKLIKFFKELLKKNKKRIRKE